MTVLNVLSFPCYAVGAISAGLFFANLMTPKTEIIKDTLKRHNISTEENLGKLIAMQEE